MVHERHKIFSDSNTKHARNPLLTKGRVSKAVADPGLRTTELLEIAQGKIKENTTSKNTVNRISNYEAWTPIKRIAETLFKPSPKMRPNQTTQQDLTERERQKQCHKEFVEDVDKPWYNNAEPKQNRQRDNSPNEKVNTIEDNNKPNQPDSQDKEI